MFDFLKGEFDTRLKYWGFVSRSKLNRQDY